MKFKNLSKDSQDYIDRCIRGTPRTREQALKDNLILSVVLCYENGELSKKSNFNVGN